jgi:hypothetical protein
MTSCIYCTPGEETISVPDGKIIFPNTTPWYVQYAPEIALAIF